MGGVWPSAGPHASPPGLALFGGCVKPGPGGVEPERPEPHAFLQGAKPQRQTKSGGGCPKQCWWEKVCGYR
eukprot:1180448-Prorocentrum_minimum.AAC.2